MPHLYYLAGFNEQRMILALSQVNDRDRAKVGAKACNLARLLRAGLPVPAGFCLTGTTYHRHLKAHGLLPLLRQILAHSDANRSTEQLVRLKHLRRSIIDAPITSQRATEIERHYQLLVCHDESSSRRDLVAVRSSATAEDLPAHSFAGLHDSYLDVASLADCLLAIKRCWASLWTERAYAYRARQRISPRNLAMAVLVQQLIPAETSGVVFTVDPVTGRDDRLIIEAVVGAGDVLVSGRASPDRVILTKPELNVVDQAATYSPVAVALDVASQDDPGTSSTGSAPAASIDPQSAVALGKLAQQAEALFGIPLDLEWARVDGQPYLLQARPVTTLAPGRVPDHRQVWTNTNTGEVVPDVMTPLTWSLVEPIVWMLLGTFNRRAGIYLDGHPLIGLVAGRAYFNLNTLMASILNFPGMRDEDLVELFGGDRQVTSALEEMRFSARDLPDLKVSRLMQLLLLPIMLYQYFAYSPATARKAIEQIKLAADKLQSIDYRELADDELVIQIQSIVQTVLDTVVASEILGMSVGFQGLFYRGCQHWFGADGRAIASRLLAGTRSNDNAQAGLALWRLAVLARQYPAVVTALQQDVSFAQTQYILPNVEGGSAFLAGWDEFMLEHGHHGRGELELSNPRWFEEPEVIRKQLRSYLDDSSDHDFEARYEQLGQQQEAVLADCLRRLPNPLSRLSFRMQLDKARGCGSARDSMRSQMVRRLAVMRLMLLELGGRLAKQGVLAEREVIFFIRYDELGQLLQPEARDDLATLIAARRAEYEHNQKLHPPPVVVGRYDPGIDAPTEVDDQITLLTGVPVNPGVVTGKARVIMRTGTDSVQPGEILVAPFTDPGWTPFFLNAAAIVTDLGGILSHGSIIAREYGIPAVVNVGAATRVIKTGQLIQVDGARGTVRIM